MRMRAFLLASCGLMFSGCIGLTDAQLEARDYQRADFKNQFIDFRQQCYARGGKLVIDANQSLQRGNIPHRNDRYYCY